MEPVTHLMMGAVLARAGVNRRAAYATAAMVLAAEMPDLDSVWRLGGPLTGFLHHRGITHSLVAMPFEAAVVTAGCWAWHRWRGRPTRKAPVNWGWLYGGVLLAVLSHLLLDWTNNYGVRWFYPFDPHWYAGSFVFIVEPLLLLTLGAALVLPALFGLINAEVGARRAVFRGRPAAIAALLAIAVLYGFRYDQHARAVAAAKAGDVAATRVFASPYPLNPYQWHVVLDEERGYRLGTMDSRTGEMAAAGPADVLYKPEGSLALLAAKRTALGRVYLDWSMYPVLTETPDTSDPHHALTLVTFADARFLYDVSVLRGREKPPLAGSVLLDMQAAEGERVVETRFNGDVQR